MGSTFELIINFLGMMFSKDPKVAELLPIIAETGTAINSAKAGQAFSVSFPESFAGTTGTTAISWTPSPK